MKPSKALTIKKHEAQLRVYWVFNFISQGNGVQLPNGSWQYRSGPLRVDYYKGSTSGFESTIWLRYHGSGSFLKLRWP